MSSREALLVLLGAAPGVLDGSLRYFNVYWGRINQAGQLEHVLSQQLGFSALPFKACREPSRRRLEPLQHRCFVEPQARVFLGGEERNGLGRAATEAVLALALAQAVRA